MEKSSLSPEERAKLEAESEALAELLEGARRSVDEGDESDPALESKPEKLEPTPTPELETRTTETVTNPEPIPEIEIPTFAQKEDLGEAKNKGRTRKFVEEKIIGKINKIKESRKNKLEPIDPEKEVSEFLETYKIAELLPAGFESLSGPKKLLIARGVQNRILDIVRQEAKTQYSEELKGKKWMKVAKAYFTKERDLKNKENEVFKKLLESEEGREQVKINSALIEENFRGVEVLMGEDNKPKIQYVNEKDLEEGDKSIATEFNSAANKFREMPYEWSLAKGGNKKDYEKAKAEYEKAKWAMSEVVKKKFGEKESAKFVFAIDHLTKIDQLLNTHPETEKEFDDLSKTAGGKELAKTGLRVLTGGGGQYGAITASGFGLRIATASLDIAAGLSAPVTGALLGGTRGFLRGKTTLEERARNARYGKKDDSTEARNVVSAKNLSQRISSVVAMLEKTTDEERKAELKDQLARRLKYTSEKIDAGLVDFGESKESFSNQLKLIDSLSLAAVRTELQETTNKETDQRLDQYLQFRERKIKTAQKAFIKKQVRNAALIGAGWATAGYLIRLAGEQWGWWGGHSSKTAEEVHKIAEKTKTDTVPPTIKGVEVTQAPKGFVHDTPSTIDTTAKIDATAVHDSVQHTDSLHTISPDSGKVGEVPKILTPEHAPAGTGTVATKLEDIPLDKDAIIGRGEGIEHAFRRQIEGDESLARSLGWNGTEDLHKFSGQAAHELAREHGYIDGLKEVRVRGGGGDVAYQIEKDTDGKIKILERLVKGGMGEDSHGPRPFETDLEKYEYHHTGKIPTEGSMHEGVKSSSALNTEELKQKVLEKMNKPEIHRTPDVDPTHGAEGIKVPTGKPDMVAPEDALPQPTTNPESIPAQRFPNQGPGFRKFTGLPPEEGSAAYYDPNVRAQMSRIYETPYASRFPHSFWGGQPGTYPRQVYPEAGMPGMVGGFSPDQIQLMELVHETNLDRIFPDNADSMWQAVKDQPVKGLLDTKLDDVGEKVRPFAIYLRKLQAETGVIPQGRSWFGLGKAESVTDYVKRAMETAMRMGKIEDIKVPKS